MTKDSTIKEGIRIAIDRGGTFCDVIAHIPGQEKYVFKILSVDPSNYSDSLTEGIRRVLSKFSGRDIPRKEKLRLDDIQSIRVGTTVATNALLERKGARVCLVTTKGFKDVLAIGNQARPDIFDLSARKLSQLYSKVLEIDQRVTLEDFTEGGSKKQKEKVTEQGASENGVIEQGVSGEAVRILKTPDYNQVERDLRDLYASGEADSIALSLVHSYVYPNHEKKIAEICRKIGFHTSVSHELQPMIGMVNRTSSTVADAYLSPIISDYIKGIAQGFEGGIDAFENKLLFMQSNGGLCPWYKFTGLKAILSGPAGGLVGLGNTCYDDEEKTATIGFDAGGTSTDVSRYDGKLEHIYETVVSEVSLQTPQLDISTVAAGGGSMLSWRNGLFVSGPESAGSDPGPTCYRKGGPLTVTDANLYLGRLVPKYFPSIFGPHQNEPLDYDATARKFEELATKINQESNGSFSPEQVASGFLKVAVESMGRPIRSLTEAKGFNPSHHNLACFGGSGGQFAVSLARNLGISKIAIHKYSSLLSAYGISTADIIIEKLSPVSLEYNEDNYGTIDKYVSGLVEAAYEDHRLQNLVDLDTKLEVFLNMRFDGSDTKLLILKEDQNDCDQRFIQKHEKEFGFKLDRSVLVQDIQVIYKVRIEDQKLSNPYAEYRSLKRNNSLSIPATSETNKTFFEKIGWASTPVFRLGNLKQGSLVEGPAIIIDDTQTILIEPKSKAVMLQDHILILVERADEQTFSIDTIDPIQLSVFSHRFMSIAEQMGRSLQQTAISTNIKERLDFSCAVFDRRGDLVANAPHIPIHLGAMSFAVKAQMEMWKGKLKPGDVLVSNHPKAGGSHLPDVTVITPVFDPCSPDPVFWTASRGHHADIGSISPGSIPSNSKTIYEEGAAIVTHKLCSEGKFDEAGVVKHFLEEPAKHKGSSGTRCLSDNISDLKAQVSANYKGITLLQALTQEFSFPVVDLYMTGIQNVAEASVKSLLKETHAKFNGQKLRAIDYLDDGCPICLEVSIDPSKETATFDFTATGDEIYGNLNAPKAILYSAVLYVLRCLISLDIPLNNGCLKSITILTREGSVVDPSFEAAVVGGNVETSQRLVDVILRAFNAAGASQGTLNNLTFGIEDKEKGVSFGYYESICGGSGAGPTWNGQSAVQCHITNTRMTDVEVFEKRYPVIVHNFAIRNGSGGQGAFSGGDGVTREIEFTYPDLSVTCLMERRSVAPYGLAGGESGQRGKNTWIRKSEKDAKTFRHIYLGGKTTIKISKGDRIIIETPGGGGYGSLDEKLTSDASPKKNYTLTIGSGSLGTRTRLESTN